MTDTFDAAMIYVMLSRACALSQILILNKFDEAKMYPNQTALEELERLNQISQNNNPSSWEKEDAHALKIYSLNCRSLNKHYNDIISDDEILKSDIICLNETWQVSDEVIEDIEIPNYQLVLNSKGKGKGIATYFKKNIFKHISDMKEEQIQISKFTSSFVDILVLYRSQKGNFNDLNQHIDVMDTKDRPLLVIGDFNFCFLTSNNNQTKHFLLKKRFTQMINEPTHIDGHLLDHAYLRDSNDTLIWTAEVQSKYYTDHKGLAIILKQKLI